MHREHKRWWSPSLGRDMDLLLFGHSGTPLLVFPSSLGRFFEWEDFGMVSALAHQLEGGHNQLVCVDSVDAESLYNKGVDPYTRINRHKQYQAYVLDEVVPFIRHRAGTDFIMVGGASFGAYHAANLYFKNPWTFRKLIAMSGSYDIKSFLNGFYDENVYFNNPVDYLPNLDDHNTLQAIRHNHTILTLGEFDPCRGGNEHLSGILNAKSIPHHYEVLHGAFGHDWPWWREVIKRHVG
ncbi:MAG: alpha/beta hydrolase-fold protein [Rhodothermales bacterium]|nr:alpha/beta hydrolase-fold protein [Rhodothermales bacterium]